MSIFDEKYRVVGIEDDRLTVRGVHTGDVLTIINPDPEIPLSEQEYPVGKLIALADPSNFVRN
jgi:hypothetical protein